VKDTTSQKTARLYGCGMIMKKPVRRQRKHVVIRNKSIRESLGFSTIVTVTKISSGPQAHHSAQIEPGDATLDIILFK